LTLRVNVGATNEHTPSAQIVATKVVGSQVCASSCRQSDVTISANDDDLPVKQVCAFASGVNQELTRSASIGHAVVTIYGN
jgi:hypothetical protein